MSASLSGMANLLRPFFKEIRSNLIYDIAKLLVLGAISMIVAGTVFLYRWSSGFPRDPVLIAFIFLGSFVLMAIAFLIARYGRKREQTSKARAPFTVAEEPKPKPKLDFEIDETESHVHVQRGGSHVSRITADIKVRCERETDSVMVVRAFRLSLHRLDTDGKVITIPYQKDVQVVWDDSKGKLIPLRDGWTIDKPRSEFRHHSFIIEITPQAQSELSPDHFLQLTMDAIGQDAVTKTVYVKDWSEGQYSLISLKPFEVFSLAAQQEIRELKTKLSGYEKTNAELGKKNKEYDWLIGEAKKHKADIDERVSFNEISFCYMDQLSPKLYRAVFALWVTNNSLLDISLDDELGGIIRFEGMELLEKKRIISPLKNAPHGGRRSATIEQRLSLNEYQTVMEAHNSMGQAYFQFDELIVNIVGGKRSPSIDLKSLKIPRNTNATAFPLTVVQRGLRIKALSQVWGRCVQLAEPLRIATDDKPLDKSVIENWQSGAIYILTREGYTEEGANTILREVTAGEAISETSGSSQRNSIYRYISVLEDLISRELKELHQPEPTRRLTHQELVRKIEALPLEERATAFKWYGEMLEQQKNELSRNTKKT
jgi:hypothetical protein